MTIIWDGTPNTRRLLFCPEYTPIHPAPEAKLPARVRGGERGRVIKLLMDQPMTFRELVNATGFNTLDVKNALATLRRQGRIRLMGKVLRPGRNHGRNVQQLWQAVEKDE